MSIKTIQVGYGEDWTGASRKYQIITETINGRYYVVRRFDGGELQLMDKDKIQLDKGSMDGGQSD